MSNYDGRFIWYELLTTDVGAAAEFYGAVVGWTAEPMGSPNPNYWLLQVGPQGAGGLMELPDEAREGGARPLWVGYIATSDVDASVTDVNGAGGTVHRAPWDIPTIGRLAMVADPQGASFMLMNPIGEGEPVPPAGTPGAVDWHELRTSNWQGAFDFYSSRFGWAKSMAMDLGPMGTYQTIERNGSRFGAMMNSETRPSWLFYFNVKDIDAAVTAIERGGGKVTNGPNQVPTGDWTIQGTDPQGAAFALSGQRG